MSKHPLEIPPGRKLSKEEIAEALRLSIIAELDAINLYLQLARAIDDEKVRKVFEDVAREEKTHVGEFLALLKQLDGEQVEELERGEREVRELVGATTVEPSVDKAGVQNPLEEIVVKEVKGFVEVSRNLIKKVPVVKVGRGVDAVVFERVGEKLERVVIPLCELSYRFRVSQAAVDRAARTGERVELAEAAGVARGLASEEEKQVVENLQREAGVKAPMNPWEEPGVAVMDVAKAVTELARRGISRPYVLVVNPLHYVKLLAISERTGVTDLERIKQLVDDVVVSPHVPDTRAIVLVARSEVFDVVFGGDAEVDYIGPEDGFHAFRLWSSIAVRVRNPEGIVLLEKAQA